MKRGRCPPTCTASSWKLRVRQRGRLPEELRAEPGHCSQLKRRAIKGTSRKGGVVFWVGYIRKRPQV
jgi:hypothetical protein